MFAVLLLVPGHFRFSEKLVRVLFPFPGGSEERFPVSVQCFQGLLGGLGGEGSVALRVFERSGKLPVSGPLSGFEEGLPDGVVCLVVEVFGVVTQLAQVAVWGEVDLLRSGHCCSRHSLHTAFQVSSQTFFKPNRDKAFF